MKKVMGPGQAILVILSMLVACAVLVLFCVLVAALAHNLWITLVG